MANKRTSDDPVRAVIAGIKARLAKGHGTAKLLSDGTDSDLKEVCPTGIDVVDHHVLGIGGLPVGRIVELFADEGDGKSSMLYQMMSGAQREGGITCLDETEHAIDAQRATVFGCDVDRVVMEQSDTLEDAYAWIEAALHAAPKTKEGDPPYFVGLDSLAATPTRKEITEGLLGKDAAMERAKITSKALRILTPLVARARAIFAVVNQTRTKIGGGWGSNRTTPGGQALKFHASMRLELFSGKSIKDAHDDHIGKQVTVMAAKTKLGGAPWAKAKVRLYYKTGWNNIWSTIYHAKDRKKVPNKAPYDEATYEEALAALGWPRGFAAGGDADPVGDVIDTDEELTGESSEDALVLGVGGFDDLD